MVLIAAISLIDCRTVETGTEARVMDLRIAGNTDGVTVHRMDPGGEKAVLRTDMRYYKLDLPAMHGGYSEALFLIRYNIHDARTYPIIRILRDGTSIQTLSIRDLQNLPEDQGMRVLTLP